MAQLRASTGAVLSLSKGSARISSTIEMACWSGDDGTIEH
jgi:hypothetical protein